MENKKESPALYRWSPSRPRWSDRADFNRYSDDEVNVNLSRPHWSDRADFNRYSDDEVNVNLSRPHWSDRADFNRYSYDEIANAKEGDEWEGEESDFEDDGNPRQVVYFDIDASDSEASEPESDYHIKEPSSRDSHKCASVEEEEAFRKAKKDPSPPDSHEYASTEEEAFREAKKDPSPTDSHESASTEEEKASGLFGCSSQAKGNKVKILFKPK